MALPAFQTRPRRSYKPLRSRHRQTPLHAIRASTLRNRRYKTGRSLHSYRLLAPRTRWTPIGSGHFFGLPHWKLFPRLPDPVTGNRQNSSRCLPHPCYKHSNSHCRHHKGHTGLLPGSLRCCNRLHLSRSLKRCLEALKWPKRLGSPLLQQS